MLDNITSASHSWNLSQNASKEKHRTAVPGIASCITPGGELFLPHAGRTLLGEIHCILSTFDTILSNIVYPGSEKLLLQGIPYFRLLLGNETEVQLGDLAGNAMSLTVVCATMLAAMTCKQLKKDHEMSNNDDILITLKSMNENHTESNNTNKLEGESINVSDEDTTDMKSLLESLSAIADDAIKSSIWCTCETSGRKSQSLNFLRCSVCSMSCCRNCVHAKQGYQLESHDMKEVGLSQQDHDAGIFEMKIRSIMPPNLVLSKEGLQEVAAIENDKYRVGSLSRYAFSLHRIKRNRNKWSILYYAREDGSPVSELKINVGQLESRTQDTNPSRGIQGELTSFFPARKDPIVLGKLNPCLLFRQYQGESNLMWMAKASDTETSLSIVGTNPGPSFRYELGLTEAAYDSLEHHAKNVRKKEFEAAKANGDERRWIYPRNWKEWPAELTIKDERIDDDSVILFGGRYVKSGCKHVFNQNACWIRKKTVDAPELYLLIQPDVSR